MNELCSCNRMEELRTRRPASISTPVPQNGLQSADLTSTARSPEVSRASVHRELAGAGSQGGDAPPLEACSGWDERSGRRYPEGCPGP